MILPKNDKGELTAQELFLLITAMSEEEQHARAIIHLVGWEPSLRGAGSEEEEASKGLEEEGGSESNE